MQTDTDAPCVHLFLLMHTVAFHFIARLVISEMNKYTDRKYTVGGTSAFNYLKN